MADAAPISLSPVPPLCALRTAEAALRHLIEIFDQQPPEQRRPNDNAMRSELAHVAAWIGAIRSAIEREEHPDA